MKRIGLLILGFLCVFLGIAGVLLPVMPGVVFFVLAAYFFSFSSETMHKLIYKIPYIGKAILEWDMTRRMGKQTKFTILSVLFGMAAYPYFLMGNKAYAIIMTNFFLVGLFTVLAIKEDGREPV